MLYEVLQSVDNDPDLSSENVIVKIDEELFKIRRQLYKNREDCHLRAKHYTYDRAHEAWRKSEFSLSHQFSDLGTLLHLASRSGCKNIIKALIEKGADIHALDERERTPLDAAVCAGNQDMIEFLLQNGAKMDYRHSSLCYAV